MNVQSVLDRIRQPEYTGDNRCIPCTLVNLAISAIVCVALWLLRWPLAVGFAVLALGSIALRGYLVPGTPTLTKRYFPDRVLALFDKEPAPTIENRNIEMDTDTETDVDTDTDIETDTDTDAPDDTPSLDTEQILLGSGVVEPCEDINDLCLASDFHEDWSDRKKTIVESDAEREALTEALDHDDSDGEGEIEFNDHGDAFTAHLDGRSVGQWESRAAFVADLAAARELPNWIDEWETLDATEQGTLVRGLRIFIETCPMCDGTVVPSQETVESCCREHTVVAIACETCDARLFETVAEPDMMNA
jgi:hypothetical protein